MAVILEVAWGTRKPTVRFEFPLDPKLHIKARVQAARYLSKTPHARRPRGLITFTS